MLKSKFSEDVCPDLKPGEYRLHELVHVIWDIIMTFDRGYGKRFKRAVLAGKVGRVRWLREGPDRRQVYQLLAR